VHVDSVLPCANLGKYVSNAHENNAVINIYTLNNAGLFQPKFGSNMEKLHKNVITVESES